MKKLKALFQHLAAFAMSSGNQAAPSEKDDFIREAEAFAPVRQSGIPGIWYPDHPIDVVIAGHLRKLTAIATAASTRWNGEPMVNVMNMGWIQRKRCHLPHPEDVVNAGDSRLAQLVRELAI